MITGCLVRIAIADVNAIALNLQLLLGGSPLCTHLPLQAGKEVTPMWAVLLVERVAPIIGVALQLDLDEVRARFIHPHALRVPGHLNVHVYPVEVKAPRRHIRELHPVFETGHIARIQ
ncbi:hypothetical protein FUT88_17850 [Ralstonia sp. TCR112]|nr:hypothetical protein FUT88_17850 [Ralstonia sp. TCR112]